MSELGHDIYFLWVKKNLTDPIEEELMESYWGERLISLLKMFRLERRLFTYSNKSEIIKILNDTID